MKKEVRFLSVLYFFETGFQYGVLLLIPFLARDLHFSITQAGLLGGAGSIAKMALTIPLTALAMRFGPIKAILIGMLFYGLSFLGIGLSHSFFILLFFFLLTGIFFSIFQPLVFGLAMRFTEKENRGKVIGIVSSMSDFGRVALAASLTFIATQLNWHMASLLAGTTTLLVFLYAFWKRPLEVSRDTKESDHLLRNVKNLLSNKSFLLSTAVAFFDTFASTSLFLFLPFLMFYRHIAISLVPILIAIFFIGGLLGKIYLGRLTDRYSNTAVFILCELCMAVALVAIANTTSLVLFGIVSFILGVLTKGTVPAAVTMASDSVEKNGEFENAYSFNFIFVSLATMLTPPLLGLVADHSSIVNSFYVCAVAALIATIPALLFRRKKMNDASLLED